MYPIYGGYEGYWEAPAQDVLEQTLVLIARHNADAQMNAEQEAEIKSQQSQTGRYR